MAYALGLPAALRARGLAVEVVPGWETRSAGSFNPKGAVCHWTAGPKGTKGRPSLNIVTNGRPGLDGPLCNVYGARDGVAVVVAAGRANHAGAGGWRGLVGNSSVFGTEMEAAGPDDFTEAQRWAYPRINAAYADVGHFGADMVCGHSEWATPTGRKTDINQYPMTSMRAQVAALLTAAPQEDDMTPDQDKKLTELYNRIMGRDVQRWMKQDAAGDPIITGPQDRDGWPARSVDIADLLQLRKELLAGDQQTRSVIDANGRATVDVAALKAALLPDLEAALTKVGPGATADQIADALAARLAS